MASPVIIKKYGNRRLYDTGDSRYITLDELATKVREGADVKVVDAKTGADLTQVTLTQVVIEHRGAAHLLPVPLLTQLIRLGDDALAEFFGRYVTGALEMYLQAKRGVQSVASYNPLAAMPFAATNALARMWMGGGAGPFGGGQGAPPTQAPMYEPPAEDDHEYEDDDAYEDDDDVAGDVAELRRELEELKAAMTGAAPKKKKKSPKKKSSRSAPKKSAKPSGSSTSRRRRAPRSASKKKRT